MEKREVERSGPHTIGPRGKRVRKQWDYVKIPLLTAVKTPPPEHQPEDHLQSSSIWEDCARDIPIQATTVSLSIHLPRERPFATHILFFLSQLLFEVSIGARHIPAINFLRGTAPALDDILLGLKYFVMETAGNAWVLRFRRLVFGNVH
jgi:ATP-binding cassette subfamily B (MDR/TAP) protein 1